MAKHSHINSYQTFIMFLALKNHFTKEDYDYFKYNGKVNTSREAFEKRPDNYVFKKITNDYQTRERVEAFFVANFLADKSWIRDFEDSILAAHMKKRQALSYFFRQDIERLFYGLVPSDVFLQRKDSYPFILTTFLEGYLSLESLLIIDRLTSFSEEFDETIGKTDLVWYKINFKMRKYKQFLNYDERTMRKHFKEVVFPS